MPLGHGSKILTYYEFAATLMLMTSNLSQVWSVGDRFQILMTDFNIQIVTNILIRPATS